MTPLEVAESFVAAINSGEVERLVSRMTPDHIFIDADGSEHVGRDQMQSGWREYFRLVPDFRIEVRDRFVIRTTIVLLGQASGTFIQHGELKLDNHWSVPAAWRVLVDRDRVAVWQLYANQHAMHVILDRIRNT
jgi:hypothetical protein